MDLCFEYGRVPQYPCHLRFWGPIYKDMHRMIKWCVKQVDLYLDQSRSVQLFENIQIQSKLSTQYMGLHSKDTKHFPFVVSKSFFFSISYSNFAIILKNVVQHQAGLSAPGTSQVFFSSIWNGLQTWVSPLCTSKTQREWHSTILKAD